MAVKFGKGMSQDVHAVGLVMEDLARFFARFHVTGGVADQLAEGNGPIFLEGVPALFWAFAFGDVHHFPTSDTSCISARCSKPA